MSESKLCKDCQHIIKANGYLYSENEKLKFAKCSKNKDLVDGGPKNFCSTERRSIYDKDCCGVDGRFFEPKINLEEPKLEDNSKGFFQKLFGVFKT